MSFMSPEQFGTIGVSPTGDTAAWNALAAAAVDGSYVQANGAYQIAGSIDFHNLPNVTLDLSGSAFQQVTRFSKTLHFTNCGKVKVIGGTFKGLGGATVGSASSNEFCAQPDGVHLDSFGLLPFLILSRIFIATAGQTVFAVSPDTPAILVVRKNSVDLTLGTQYTVSGGTVTLVTPAALNDQIYSSYVKGPTPDTSGQKISGGYNGVAGIYATNCDSIEVEGAHVINHAGGGIGGLNTPDVIVQNCHIEGIGPNYIAQHENGSDFALGFSLGLAFSQNFVCRWSFTNNRLFNHAFGIAGLLTKSLIVQGNDMGPFPGQHGIYASDCNGLNVTGNEIRDCGEICIKLQQENRILSEMGIPAWSAGSYAAGQKVIKYSGCWEATLAFTSANWDAEYALGKWVFSEDNHLHDVIVSGNTLTNSLYGIQFPSTTPVFASAERIKGCKIDNNVIRNIRGAGADGIKIERCIDAVVNDNLIEDCDRYGIYLRDCSGTIRDNTILRTAACGIFGLMSFDSDIVGNIVEDSGLTGAAGNDRIPVSLVNTDTNGIAGADATPKLTLRDNDIRFTLAGLAGTYLVYTDTTYSVDMIGTRTNMSTSMARVDGPLLRTLDNQFGTYVAGDHTIPATFREGRSGREWYGSAAPATGFHYIGEFCWNVAAVAGNPLGWKCVSSGTPGTWIAGPAYP